MSDVARLAPSPQDWPIEVGTAVSLEPGAQLLDRDLIAGGSPWRLLRLPGGARAVAERWRSGGEVHVGEERFARTLVQQGLLFTHYRVDATTDDVQVVIPVVDDVASLRPLLESLRGLSVTVVDDGSRHAQLVRECAHDFGATLVRLDVNRGPGAARNAGLSQSDAPFVWFLDVDVTLEDARGVLARLRAAMRDPLAGAVSARIRGGPGASARDRFEMGCGPLDLGERDALVVAGGAVSYVPSACLLVRRTALAGGFDETMRVGEDVDLVWRLSDQGWLVRYLAGVTVTHRARGTWRHWWGQRVGYGRSAAALASRHGQRVAPVRVDLWTVLAWSSVLARQPMIGARVVRALHVSVRARLPASTEEPARVARSIVHRGVLTSSGPFARALVRTYGPLLLIAALHPRLRRRALGIFILGSAWRWRNRRAHASDAALGIFDDLAYSVGVWRGAFEARSPQALRPYVVRSSMRLRDVLGLRAPSES